VLALSGVGERRRKQRHAVSAAFAAVWPPHAYHFNDTTPRPGVEENALIMETTVDLAALIRTGDLQKLREELLYWRPQELAATLCLMRPDDQVIAFRILPRESAATVFEYLPVECQQALVKAMGQEDVARLLNNMSPDDRTLLLSELPANATKQLLTLLTPEERAEAITFLGYAPGTVGRRMTPHYIAVRKDWTVQQVLDYVREHGQDSETLNVIDVVDDAGVLIDDIRIREFLLAPLTMRVSDLMDRRYVALKATDTQESAVAVFRREDRTALPVTDTAGVLIGIVTVDDVLDIAEETATREFQLFGGSEALDERESRYGRHSPICTARTGCSWR
jgi:magnesium transporter